MLDLQAFNSPEGVDNALSIIETICNQGGPGVAQVVAVLNSRPHLLEYIISGTLSVFIGPRVL
jgi:hypothetical protein